ncbi:MFS general substrate transporter-45 [Coleophoma crateriformis]|uniref:MFS general substrate transporter-45 n=1 Tax=Coleophoma crateriformis TaxID=565419 RepID=A0A3D8SZS2_9HELO|nr:MFS general substrate transporter-45 [Coleophoma crateriformis]
MSESDVKMAAASANSTNSAEKFEASRGEVDAIFVDPELERRTLRKFDQWLLPPLTIILLLAYLDRSNMGNAKIFGFTEGIGLKGNQFNIISTCFYPTYVVFETPWTMAVKRFGAKPVLGVAMVAWSIVTLSMGFIHNYHQAIALHVLLGTFEAGLVPCIVFIISTIWAREAQAKRNAIIYGCNCLSGAFGGLIAYGIESMGTRHGLESWRWLFIVEGAASVGLCGICWFLLPNTAEDAWFLTAQEKECMRTRKFRDIVNRGSADDSPMEYVKMAFSDVCAYLAAACLFCCSIAIFGFGTFLPTIIKGLGYTSLQANYLTIPVYIFATCTLAAATFASDLMKKRTVVLCILPIPVIVGYIMVCATANHAIGFFAMFLCGGGIYAFNCILLTWVSNNLAPDYKRSVGVPLFICLGNISGIVSSNIYPSSDSPRYIMGNAVSAGMEFLALGCVVVMWWTLKRRNSEKERMRAEGLEENGKHGDKALDFVYNL